MAINDILETLREAWDDLSPNQKTIVGVLAALDTAGKAWALRDLARTDAGRIRGPKWLWTPIIATVNTAGWLAYFAVGKKR
ncbi:PLDc N-terminal domain-containing protein [Corynebacterium riegelii]|uniref:PLDc N-terminal domain-containing protein n=1 Tax=Corynebacterium riegelii TaxID=156976 RepID=UPI00288ADAD7|nr:PLDc N-terminal domain-containing protein [Corynebacterium riegelii]